MEHQKTGLATAICKQSPQSLEPDTHGCQRRYQDLPDIPINADDPLCDIEETKRQSGHGKSWIYENSKKGLFPKPLKIGGQNYWFLSQINLWKRSLVEAARKGNT